ncbi:Hydrogen peroxide-inducible genes activator [Zhongshania aliphaticivorans]|uniref:Hydrogen peroxide-inducible genes activator n=1 Tax=Zhongshania aliphaticivorans TaxID=1470434 RepID=A0A5S9MPV9_9GAMM|nr:DNA-binding transcriptional regulator OxyR [Zhongshania aliphaticivorans]CAA0078916.1 Hydrogen peroxide-inducible genes activator [Zhongshania aliphaticivorans]CAA0086455.1 Hydrogen peroxide-inducible genes activator [Zhongshania aliphaticivorans]
MIKIRDLQYLDAVAREEHFGRAAESCFVSQPTLSGQIMKLEDQLGLTLFERHRKKVMLTPAGRELLSRARQVLRSAEAFEEAAKALADPLSGDLHIGLIPTVAPYLLPHIMTTLGATLPNINFYLHENQTDVLLQQLDEGKLDVLILSWLPTMEGMVERYTLFNEPLVLASPNKHPLAQNDALTLKDLNGQWVLTLEDGHCLRDEALDYCFSAGAREDTRFQATSLETLRYMVASGMGITLIPELAIKEGEHGLQYTHFKAPVPSREICLLVRPNYSRMQCVRAVVSSIRSSMAQYVG